MNTVRKMIAEFSGKTSLLCTDMATGEVFLSHDPAVRVPAASTIKVPILLAALEMGVDLHERVTVAPAAVLPDSEVFDLDKEYYTFWELLYWMIVKSDNTATNLVIDRLGFDAVNRFCAQLGLTQTVLARKMLDFAAAARGQDNQTSAADQCKLYRALYNGEILNPELQSVALDILRRQRSADALLRYIPDPVTVAHKTGGLDYVAHDAGVFEMEQPFFLGIFTWDGPSPEGDAAQKQYIGRLAEYIYGKRKEEKYNAQERNGHI